MSMAVSLCDLLWWQVYWFYCLIWVKRVLWHLYCRVFSCLCYSLFGIFHILISSISIILLLSLCYKILKQWMEAAEFYCMKGSPRVVFIFFHLFIFFFQDITSHGSQCSQKPIFSFPSETHITLVYQPYSSPWRHWTFPPFSNEVSFSLWFFLTSKLPSRTKVTFPFSSSQFPFSEP